MHSKDKPSSWSKSELTLEERYWEHGLDEYRQLLERQNSAVETKRSTLISFTRYHFIFLGFVFATAKLGSGVVPISRWEIVLTCLPSLCGIFLTAQAHNSLGTYALGFDTSLFKKTQDESKSYLDALKSISGHYHNMAQLNRDRLNSHSSVEFNNQLLLALGFGLLIGSIMF